MAEKTKYIIKWTNKYSNEEGYVCSIKKSKGYFVNTWIREDAKKYTSVSSAEKDIKILEEIGEALDNWFSVEEL